MGEFVNVPEFFSSVYLVDFSPSLCEVARQRFARLGWSNVHVICQDARKFKLANYEDGNKTPTRERFSPAGYFAFDRSPETGGADLVTMSYSLSMMVSPALKASRPAESYLGVHLHHVLHVSRRRLIRLSVPA